MTAARSHSGHRLGSVAECGAVGGRVWCTVAECCTLALVAVWCSVAVVAVWCSVAVGEECGSCGSPSKKTLPALRTLADTFAHRLTCSHILAHAQKYPEICTNTDIQSEPVSKESFAVLQTQIKSTTGLVAARANAIFLACTTQGIPKCIGMRAQIHYSALKVCCDVKLLH